MRERPRDLVRESTAGASLALRLLRKLLVGLSAYLASLPEGQAPPLMVTLSHSASTMLGVDLDVSKGEAKLGECGRV